jgi:glycosyltransferase involved in cell wall biosynthesis
MRVVYVTYPSYLDFSIEYISELKKVTDLDVFVILNTFHLKSTILDIRRFSFEVGQVVPFKELESHIANYDILESYINGCRSFNFIMFPDKSLSLSSVGACKKLSSAINRLNPEIVHFDDLITHLLGIRFYLKTKKIIANVHDPEPHSGENNWKRDLIRSVFYPRVKVFLLYSKYSTERFNAVYKKYRNKRIYTLSLIPYYFYSKIGCQAIKLDVSQEDFVLLFFGRISLYKGIDELLAAFSQLYEEFPSFKLIIAGKGDYKFILPETLRPALNKRITIINRFITNGELAFIMEKASLVVCPYRDATQSGVVMTAFGFKKLVIVSKVGGLFEPVTNGDNGYIYEKGDEMMLKEAIQKAFVNKTAKYDFKSSAETDAGLNAFKLVSIYKSLANIG